MPARGGRCIVGTGISLEIPEHVYARIAPRSGLAVKHGIDVLAGVVDSDYRGEVRVVLINHGDEPFVVRPGDRIAQILFELIASPPPVLQVTYALGATERGAGGFGSTGMAA